MNKKYKFKRKVYSKLLEWKKREGKTALLIEGARRIGKSTIAEIFAENEYATHITIDFSVVDDEVKSLFDSTMDLDYIFLRLQSIYGVTLHNRKSLIIFDEVQFNPKARQAIKHLVADGRYDYIETGSLISIRKNTINILIPSEEERIEMYPMDFEEFLWAQGNTQTFELLRHAYSTGRSLGESTNRRLMRDFRIYMLVGGMPQAVATYLEKNNFAEVDRVKRGIISLYEEDLLKVDSSGRLSRIFLNIPSQLQKKASSFSLTSSIGRVSRQSEEELMSELSASKIANFCYCCIDPGSGLSYAYYINKYKIYLGDTGLFVTMIFNDKENPDEDLYNKLLNERLQSNLGYLYENVVAQVLKSSGHNLYYYLFSDSEKKKTYEVDFLIRKDKKICPLEVKSSSYKRHVSLDLFMDKYSSAISESVVLTTKDLSRDQENPKIAYLPMYIAALL